MSRAAMVSGNAGVRVLLLMSTEADVAATHLILYFSESSFCGLWMFD